MWVHGRSIETFTSGGKKQWDAEIGELWLVEPEEKLIINHRDAPLVLVLG